MQAHGLAEIIDNITGLAVNYLGLGGLHYVADCLVEVLLIHSL